MSTPTPTNKAPVTTTEYFGGCPECGKNDGYVNVGRDHWMSCKEHKTRWWVGSNLFSSWQYETEEQQRAVFDGMNLGEYREVEPIYDESRFQVEPTDKPVVLLGDNNCGVRLGCAICHDEPDKARVGLEYRTPVGNRFDHVCERCGDKYADPELRDLFNFIWAAGLGAGQMRSPEMAALIYKVLGDYGTKHGLWWAWNPENTEAGF